MKAATVGSIPGRDRKKDRFSGLPSLGLHLCMHEDLIFGACLAVVYTARTKILAHVKYPTPTFRQAEVKPNGRWHGNVEMMCCDSRIIILKLIVAWLMEQELGLRVVIVIWFCYCR